MKKTLVLILIITACVSIFPQGMTKSKVNKTVDGITYVDLVDGKGTQADSGRLANFHMKIWSVKDTVNVYSDWSGDTTKLSSKIMDSKEEGQIFSVVLKSTTINPYIETAIVGMKEGGIREMLVPAKLVEMESKEGYFPPNTPIKVEVELKQIKEQVKMWTVDEKSYKKTPSGLQYSIIKEGSGPKAKAGDTVTVHYSGYLLDGKKFDSSIDRDDPIKFVLGVKQVIAGWDEGIALLKKGSKAKFKIPASLAYGERGAGNVIPPNATLIFDVELVDIK